MTKLEIKKLPPQEYLKSRLRYDEREGKLFWKARPSSQFKNTNFRSREHNCNAWNAKLAGKEAFTAVSTGYKVGIIDGERYLAHRIIWKIMTGEDPIEIDHKDRNRSNNKLTNLSNVSSSGNNLNLPKSKRNRSGVTGVYWSKQKNYWASEICLKGNRSRRTFKCLGKAVRWRLDQQRKMGFSENHGK